MPKNIRTRKQAINFINKQLPKHGGEFYGRVQLSELLDYIYGPTTPVPGKKLFKSRKECDLRMRH